MKDWSFVEPTGDCVDHAQQGLAWIDLSFLCAAPLLAIRWCSVLFPSIGFSDLLLFSSLGISLLF
jgi:hypothetical protein